MRVGIYGVDVPETVGGGFVLYSDVIKAVLRSPGRHEFEIVGASVDGAVQSAPSSLRRLTRFAPSLRRISRAIRANQLRSDIERKRIDLIWNLHMAPLDVGLPYMTTILDLEYRLYPWFPELSANGEWEERERATAAAVHHASIIISGSNVVRDQIHEFFGVPLERIAVLPFPVPQGATDAANTDPAKRAAEERRIRDTYRLDGPFLFYPAQFWAHKNHVNLLHALRILREQHGLPFSLVLTGSDHGNFAHVKATAASLGLEEAVRMPGFVPRADIVAFYQAATALTFISFHGPENLPVLEAQTLGCPALLSDIPGVRELYGEGPLLVNPRDPASIASGIKRMHEDAAFRERSLAIGRETAAKYTYEKYVAQVHELLDGFEPVRRCWPAGAV